MNISSVVTVKVVATGAQDMSLRTWLLALQVLIHTATPATAAVRRYAQLTAQVLTAYPALVPHLQAPDWKSLCERVAVRS